MNKIKKILIILIIIIMLGILVYIYKNNNNSDIQKVAVLNYHFLYDESKGEICRESICIEKKAFEEQLLYLKENNFKTLTIKEFKQWIYGELEIPEKSVLITIDDGAMGIGKNDGNILIPLLEKYNMHATLFLITSKWDTINYISKNLDIESHGNNIHENGSCGKAKVECYSVEELHDDIKTSIERTGDNTAFAFPFYLTSKNAFKALNQLGVKIAFVGGNEKATQNNDKYKIPRYKMYNSTSMEEFKTMVNT